MARTLDTSGLEVTSKARRVDGKWVLSVYVEAPDYFTVVERGIGKANVVASKKGYRFLEGVKEWPINLSPLTGLHFTRRDYTLRRGN